jgi:DNA-binding NarL/FixJ family response regulator
MMRVAIAEDHPELRVLLRLLLGRLEHIEIVFEAENGLEVIDLVQQHRPDVLVMDIRMPRLDGVSAAQQINNLLLSTRVILISSLEGPGVIQSAMAAGAHGFVYKGDLLKLLLDAVETVCNGGLFLPEEYLL